MTYLITYHGKFFKIDPRRAAQSITTLKEEGRLAMRRSRYAGHKKLRRPIRRDSTVVGRSTYSKYTTSSVATFPEAPFA